MKKIVRIAFIAVVVAVAGLGVYTSQGEEIEMSDVALANVEALADNESGCHYTNGYRIWDTDSWFGTKKEFYDCCNSFRSGYSPSGSCN